MEFRQRYRQLDAWFRDHPAVWIVAAASVPGAAVAVAHVLLTDEPVVGALFFGLVFGVTYATLSTVL